MGKGCKRCAYERTGIRASKKIYKDLGITGNLREQTRYRRKNDTIFSLKLKLRCRFNHWLKATKTIKKGSGLSILQEYIMMEKNSFIAYYESLFLPGMTWENTHIDHHIPLSHFDPTSEEDNKIAWNWYNLRPLLGEDNNIKFNKLPDDYEDVLATIKEIIEHKVTDPKDLVFDLRLMRDRVRIKA